MSVFDNFAENWLKWKQQDRELRAKLPKTADEANERFAEEMGPRIHEILYALREEVERYWERPLEVPMDAFIPSNDAEMVYHAIVNLQSEMSQRDILP